MGQRAKITMAPKVSMREEKPGHGSCGKPVLASALAPLAPLVPTPSPSSSQFAAADRRLPASGFGHDFSKIAVFPSLPPQRCDPSSAESQMLTNTTPTPISPKVYAVSIATEAEATNLSAGGQAPPKAAQTSSLVASPLPASSVPTPAHQTPQVFPAPDGIEKVRQLGGTDNILGSTQEVGPSRPPQFTLSTKGNGQQWRTTVKLLDYLRPQIVAGAPGPGMHNYIKHGDCQDKLDLSFDKEKKWSEKIVAGEQEHIDDINEAYHRTWEPIKDAIVNAVTQSGQHPFEGATWQASQQAATDAIFSRLPSTLRPSDGSAKSQQQKWEHNDGLASVFHATGQRDQGGAKAEHYVLTREIPELKEGCNKLYVPRDDALSKLGHPSSPALIDEALKQLDKRQRKDAH